MRCDYNPLGKNKYYNKLNQNLQFARFATECNECGDNDIFLLCMWFSVSFFPFLFHTHTYTLSTLLVKFFFSHAQTWPTNTLYRTYSTHGLPTGECLSSLLFPILFLSSSTFLSIFISFGWVCWFCSRHHYYMYTLDVYIQHAHTYTLRHYSHTSLFAQCS